VADQYSPAHSTRDRPGSRTRAALDAFVAGEPSRSRRRIRHRSLSRRSPSRRSARRQPGWEWSQV